MNVTVPQFPSNEKRSASVLFSYRELNGTIIYEIIKSVNVNVVGISYSGESNTILGGFNNPLPPPLNTPYGALILNILIWIIVAFLIYLFINYIIHALVRKTKTKLDDAIMDIIRKPVLIIVILYGFITSVLKLSFEIGIRVSLYQIFTVIVLGIVVYILYKVYDEILKEISIRRGGLSSSFGRVLRPIFRIIGAVVLIIGGLIYGLSIFNINVTALLAGAGVFGIVIAFAAQDTLSNFFSGIHLLLDRPFRIGDMILLDSGEYCRVENVGMRSTKLYSLFDHELIILPNNSIANQKIINIVKPDMKIRKRVEVGVAYGSDVEKVKKILYECASNHPDVLTEGDEEPLVRFTGFGESSLDFIVIFTIDDVMKQWKVKSDVVTEIDKRFRKANITIPFPQRTIWFNKIKNPNIKSNSRKNEE
jgi:small-conductance mechanosensitive channel